MNNIEKVIRELRSWEQAESFPDDLAKLGEWASQLELAAPQPAGETSSGAPYGIIDPDYARIYTIARAIAWSEGYAIAMHGSFTRDLDLIAVPWAKRVCNPEHLVNRVVDATGLRNKSHSNPGAKPHGRLAWTLHLPDFGDPRWVDLSILPAMPSEPAHSGTENVEALAKSVLDARSHLGSCRPDDPDDARQWDRLTEAARHLSGAKQAHNPINPDDSRNV